MMQFSHPMKSTLLMAFLMAQNSTCIGNLTQVPIVDVDYIHNLVDTKLVKANNNNQKNGTVFKDDVDAVINHLAGLKNEVQTDILLISTDRRQLSSNYLTQGDLIFDFLREEIKFCSQTNHHIMYHKKEINEVSEDPCIKRTVSLSKSSDNYQLENTELQKDIVDLVSEQLPQSGVSIGNDKNEILADVLDETKMEIKLGKPHVLETISQRQASGNLDKIAENKQTLSHPSFEEPVIKSLLSMQKCDSLDIDDEEIAYKWLELDTRDSSAQSDSIVYGYDYNNIDAAGIKTNWNANETDRAQLMRYYTIAGDEARNIFKSVTIDETAEYINVVRAANDLLLDDEMSENIRKKMMAYSLSKADSYFYDLNKPNQDDFEVNTSLDDIVGTSTDTESTIVSAATKIQAGARGFLIRRKLRRASAGTKSSTQETKVSFGNAAISESIERLIEIEAAKKIQAAFRLHRHNQKKKKDNIKSISLESSLAARRQTLQRGDAMRNDSTPDDDNSTYVNNIAAKNGDQQVEKAMGTNVKISSKTKINSRTNWQALRQNSMPVQIDCEVLRIFPKHIRKRIKSAEAMKLIQK